MTPRPYFPAAASLLVAAAIAQTPGPQRQAPPDTELVSLQLLTTETIYTRHPLGAPPARPAPQDPPAPAPAPPTPAPEPAPSPAGGPQGPGTFADRPFALVRDAQFGADGRLIAFLVDAPPGTANERDAAPRVLPAKSAQWDHATRRWLTEQPTLQFAELAVHEPGRTRPAAPSVPAGRTLLASELLTARWFAPAPAVGTVEASATRSGQADVPERIVWWFAPAPQQIAFAVVPAGERYLPIPFPAVRTAASGAGMEARLENATTANEHAPHLASPAEAPGAELRRRCYEHYGAPTPRWDRARQPAGSDADDDKAASSRARGGR